MRYILLIIRLIGLDESFNQKKKKKGPTEVLEILAYLHCYSHSDLGCICDFVSKGTC